MQGEPTQIPMRFENVFKLRVHILNTMGPFYCDSCWCFFKKKQRHEKEKEGKHDNSLNLKKK